MGNVVPLFRTPKGVADILTEHTKLVEAVRDLQSHFDLLDSVVLSIDDATRRDRLMLNSCFYREALARGLAELRASLETSRRVLAFTDEKSPGRNDRG